MAESVIDLVGTGLFHCICWLFRRPIEMCVLKPIAWLVDVVYDGAAVVLGAVGRCLLPRLYPIRRRPRRVATRLDQLLKESR